MGCKPHHRAELDYWKAQAVNVFAQTTLENGDTACLEHDPYTPGAVQLTVNGTPQSHVHTHDNTQLYFAYMRRIGNVLDCLRPEGTPIAALHLGGGAFTLPRYVEATRPGSRQQVVEHSGQLVDFVRTHLPLPRNAQIRVRRGDAREVAAKLPNGLLGKVDAVILDCFAGSRTPAHLTSSEFYQLLTPLLAPGGVLIINCADGSGGKFVRSQLATLKQLFSQVAAIGEPQVLKGRRFGNIILLASTPRTPAPHLQTAKTDPDTQSVCFNTAATLSQTGNQGSWQWLPRVLNSGPHPARMLTDTELDSFIAGAKPVTDAAAQPSPLPPAGIFG